MPSLPSRVTGALLGLHAGDSLGATLEFASHAEIKRRHPSGLRSIIGGGPFSWAPGAATDDTDMTRGVLLAYRDVFLSPAPKKEDGEKDEDAVLFKAGEYFLAWEEGDWPGRRKGSAPVDIGGATSQGLYTFRHTRNPYTSGAPPGSAGNGSLMRCLPTGLFLTSPERLIHESLLISSITHRDTRCTVACAVYNTIVSSLLQGHTAEHAVGEGEKVATTLEKEPHGPVHEAILLGRSVDLASLAEHGPTKNRFPGLCSGYVLETLTLGVAAVLDARSLEDVLVDVVRVGKDTDTNGAVAGGLLGARDGEEAIPEEWRSVLQFRDEFRQVALAILEAQGRT